jgi:7-cyano-7-deazaguanine synthase
VSKSDVTPSSMGSKRPDSCAIFSGGLDSTVLVYDMLEEGYTPHLLSFDYGQRHNKELTFAKATAQKLDLRHDIINLRELTHLISNSALTSGTSTGDNRIEVPEGHYAEDNMKATVVPNRNMIMLSIACGIAVNNKYRTVGTGVHGGDHFIYPKA